MIFTIIVPHPPFVWFAFRYRMVRTRLSTPYVEESYDDWLLSSTLTVPPVLSELVNCLTPSISDRELGRMELSQRVTINDITTCFYCSLRTDSLGLESV